MTFRVVVCRFVVCLFVGLCFFFSVSRGRSGQNVPISF